MGTIFQAMSASGEVRPHLWRNARLATLDPQKQGLGIVEKGAVVVEGGRIRFVGPESGAAGVRAIERAAISDLEGRWVTPGLVDCHTHIVYGGNRAREFEMRLEGATYEEIARAGGGIVSSVKATNALIGRTGSSRQPFPVWIRLLLEGVTTIEIKSGYGLNIEAELKMLRAARQLERVRPVRVVTSYLGAHATPVEYKGRNTDYITDVVLPGLEQAHAEGPGRRCGWLL